MFDKRKTGGSNSGIERVTRRFKYTKVAILLIVFCGLFKIFWPRYALFATGAMQGNMQRHLHEIYLLQTEYRQKSKAFASSLKKLNVPQKVSEDRFFVYIVESSTASNFIVTAKAKPGVLLSDRCPQPDLWQINETSEISPIFDCYRYLLDNFWTTFFDR